MAGGPAERSLSEKRRRKLEREETRKRSNRETETTEEKSSGLLIMDQVNKFIETEVVMITVTGTRSELLKDEHLVKVTVTR